MRRVEATDEALELLDWLTDAHGPVLLHLPDDAEPGSPRCLPRRAQQVQPHDVLLGHLGRHHLPVWVGGEQFGWCQHAHLVIDVDRGDPGGASLEALEGVRFVIRSRLHTADEDRALAAGDPPLRGADLEQA